MGRDLFGVNGPDQIAFAPIPSSSRLARSDAEPDFDSAVVGLKLGLSEGIEVHIWTLALGLDLWPPALIVPVGDGRLGFADR